MICIMRNRKKIKASPPKPSALLFPGPRNTFTTDSSHQAVQGMARGQMEWGLHSVHPSPSQLLCPASLSPALGCSLLGTACSCGAPHGHSSFKKYPLLCHGPSTGCRWDLLQVGSVGLQGIHVASLEAQPVHRETQHLGTGTVTQCYGRAFT